MKPLLLAIALIGLAGAAKADEKVTISGVHNCCGGCAAGIKKAAGSVAGVTTALEGDKLTLGATNAAELQKAVDALAAAGYTGTSDNAAVKATTGNAPDEKVTSLTVTGAHMCCGSCVKAAQKAIKSVAGVKSDTVTTRVDTFKVEGEFNAKELMAALAKAGFTGKATK